MVNEIVNGVIANLIFAIVLFYYVRNKPNQQINI